MAKNSNDKIKKLRPRQRNKGQARASELIAEKLLSQILKEVKAEQRRMERSLDATIASCKASSARIERLAQRVSDRYDDGFAQSIGTGSNLQASRALLSRAMTITGHRSRRTVKDNALRMLLRIKRQAAARNLKGQIHFDTDTGGLQTAKPALQETDKKSYVIEVVSTGQRSKKTKGSSLGPGKSQVNPLLSRITSDPKIRSGKPIVRDLRVTVEDVLEYLAAGMTDRQILKNFPGLTQKDILACFAYAAKILLP